MNKYILYSIVIPVSVLIGKILLIKTIDRRVFFTDFSIFIKKIETEINFTFGSIKDSIKILDKKSNFYKLFIKTFFKKESCHVYFLTKNETSFFKSFCLNLGKTDRITQIKFIEQAKKEVDLFLAEAIKIEKRNVKLYFKLSVLIGILIYILII